MTSKLLSEYVASKVAQGDFDNVKLANLIATVGKETVKAFQEAAATGVIARYIATKPMRISKVKAKAAVCGTANTTSFMPKIIRKDAAAGAAVNVLAASLDIGNAVADGLNVDAGAFHATDANRDLAVGDELLVEVTAAATGATGLAVTVELEPLIDV